ncbi:type IV toxin-antitoxin system AbiEi family antitoxin domain-containing protein [Woeseia oceani]|uniref:AbiEi antitoxin C-terminal domain-containing protein n=1 Tax=Woeseia oceani TaxID=1548547 RepID=A0A193LBY7_9GAMM|nr:hypothetical protein [Woeseia oceani]ANO49983.1 hypothetical protein BA177_00990 [Woeseia oceani]
MTEFRLPPFETAALLVKDKLRASGLGIFSLSALRCLVDAAITPWPYDGRRPSSSQVIEKLIEEKVIRHLIVKSHGYTDISRYAFGSISIMELAASLKSNAYLSHWSAANIHSLSQLRSPTIYVNKEQSKKPPPKGPLSQAAIDRAFANRQRRSKFVFEYEAQTFTILNGKHTEHSGVIEVPIGSRDIRVTNVPRTLIDITVRPGYAGGVTHVAEVFRSAVDKIDIDALLQTLQDIDHKYPFHQALGYYLTLAGIPQSQLAPLRAIGIKHKFYLDYGMSNPRLDDTWQVYVPADLTKVAS